jgi:molybdopterin synthase catalytic subunit
MTAALTADAISLSILADSVCHSGAGALVTFEGVVRDKSRDTSGQLRAIQYLEYEAYIPMAEREMARVVKEVEARWDVHCAALHRVGKLQIGEVAVVIVVTSAHRGEAFEACRFAIDRIKETVPIWKKEVAQDGTWWVENPVNNSVENPVETFGSLSHAKHPAATPQLAR